jgi:pilus assembly protein CpaB
MFEDEPVLKGRVAAAGSGAGLAPMIAEGQRAVSVRVNDVIGVAGFVQPGMRVDVVVTGRPPGSNDSMTRTVLQNVTVLSAGQVLQAGPKGNAINAPVVTLQVTPEEAEVLVLAAGEGHIQLVLRNPADRKREATEGTALSSLYGVRARPMTAAGDFKDPDPPPRSPPMPRPPAVKTVILPAPSAAPARTIEVVRGTKKTEDPIDSPTAHGTGDGTRGLN